MKRFLCLCLGLALMGRELAAFEEKVEKLTPPIITDASIDQKLVCTRPMREGKFNISTERKEEKIVVHCYGHGGSGCTTSWGSVFKAIELYEEQFGSELKQPIRVVGCGIIGLTAAIELTRKGYQVHRHDRKRAL